MIAVVVPSCRPDSFKSFLAAWQKLFIKHSVVLIITTDGDFPTVSEVGYSQFNYGVYRRKHSIEEVMGPEYKECISSRSSASRNLSIAYVAKFLPQTKIIISLDDDIYPTGEGLSIDNDPIADHLTILGQKVPTSWMSTTLHGCTYMRGFPYSIRQEKEVKLSHGVWIKNYDLDGCTQLVVGNKPVEFYRGIIPQGIHFPCSSMNLAFTRDLLPHIYMAPPGKDGVGQRWDDIWAGVSLVNDTKDEDVAIVTGYSTVYHTRKSDVYKNIQKECLGLPLNETYYKQEPDHPYFEYYNRMKKLWKKFIEQYSPRKTSSSNTICPEAIEFPIPE